MRHAEERHARSHQGCQLGTDWTRAEERPVDREQSFRLQKDIPMESIVVAEHLGQSIKGVEEGLKFCGEPRPFRDRFERGGPGDLDRTAVVPAKDVLAVSAQRVLALAVEHGTAIYERVAGLWRPSPRPRGDLEERHTVAANAVQQPAPKHRSCGA